MIFYPYIALSDQESPIWLFIILTMLTSIPLVSLVEDEFLSTSSFLCTFRNPAVSLSQPPLKSLGYSKMDCLSANTLLRWLFEAVSES